MGEILTTHVATGENVADLATKVIMNRPKRAYLIGKLLFDISNDPWNNTNNEKEHIAPLSSE